MVTLLITTLIIGEQSSASFLAIQLAIFFLFTVVIYMSLYVKSVIKSIIRNVTFINVISKVVISKVFITIVISS
jgi:hypothetical protein